MVIHTQNRINRPNTIQDMINPLAVGMANTGIINNKLKIREPMRIHKNGNRAPAKAAIRLFLETLRAIKTHGTIINIILTGFSSSQVASTYPAQEGAHPAEVHYQPETYGLAEPQYEGVPEYTYEQQEQSPFGGDRGFGGDGGYVDNGGFGGYDGYWGSGDY
ncbi:hypothetical protein QR680_013774 [Steinernema hermaphroditum]|uniref:Uncharacterized protein n=1 Tax=Steinernema hermaphroditum TaxID=289476 RepID=A0AA39M334_9BILA|nr:hypothetical protein QR680_013774 [Steinernema hermaphroditum]